MNVSEILSFTGKLFEIGHGNTYFLLIIFFLFILIAYKIFKTLLKAVIVGIISGFFPVFAYLTGMTETVTLNQMIWFGLAGISLFFIYTAVSGGVKIISWIFKPFKFMFKEKKKD